MLSHLLGPWRLRSAESASEIGRSGSAGAQSRLQPLSVGTVAAAAAAAAAEAAAAAAADAAWRPPGDRSGPVIRARGPSKVQSGPAWRRRRRRPWVVCPAARGAQVGLRRWRRTADHALPQQERAASAPELDTSARDTTMLQTDAVLLYAPTFHVPLAGGTRALAAAAAPVRKSPDWPAAAEPPPSAARCGGGPRRASGRRPPDLGQLAVVGRRAGRAT